MNEEGKLHSLPLPIGGIISDRSGEEMADRYMKLNEILSKMGTDEEKNKQRLLENIENGKAYNKFLELVKNQGGDISYIEDINKFPKAKYQKNVIANKMGYVNSINALEIGKLACYLGAGRIEKEDNIDHEVGIVLNKKVGNKV